MKTDLNTQDQILATIGLNRLMIRPSAIFSLDDKSKFKRYVTSEYNESERKETDEIYRMFEFNLLHVGSGLRMTITSHESYDGNTVEYKVIRMFIVTSWNKEFEVTDVNFENEIIYASDSEFPFAETNKEIERLT